MATYLTPPETYDVLGTKQVAQLLEVHMSTVARWIDAGDMVAARTPSGRYRVARADIIRFLNARRMPVPTSLLAHQAQMFFEARRARR